MMVPQFGLRSHIPESLKTSDSIMSTPVKAMAKLIPQRSRADCVGTENHDNFINGDGHQEFGMQNFC